MHPGRWFAIAGVVVLSAIGAGGVAVAVYMAWLFHSLPDARQLAEAASLVDLQVGREVLLPDLP